MTTLSRLCLIAVLTASAASAQQMDFDALDHEMGRLSESEPGQHTFRFTNVGDAPLTLVEVESNCGCTIPAYTSDAVGPGESGEVAVRYETAGRPGPFEKAVRVVADGGQAVTLRVSGVVEPMLATTGVAVGALSFATLDKDLGVLNGPELQTSVQFANAGTRPVRVERVEAPDGVDIVFPRGPVFADHLGGLFVTATDAASLADADGVVAIPLAIVTDDAVEPVKRIVIRARV